jgi:hypothetical protein
MEGIMSGARTAEEDAAVQLIAGLVAQKVRHDV